MQKWCAGTEDSIKLDGCFVWNAHNTGIRLEVLGYLCDCLSGSVYR